MIQIKHKITQKVLKEDDGADLREADLYGATIKITQQDDFIKSLAIVVVKA